MGRRRVTLLLGLLVALGHAARAQAPSASIQRLPIREAQLPQVLGSTVGPALAIQVDRSVRLANGARARLVVYVAPCECDSGEPTATRLGLYLASGPDAGLLVHSRAWLIQHEPGEARAFISAELRGEGEQFALRTATFSFERARVGASYHPLRHRSDSLFRYSADGRAVLAGAIAPAEHAATHAWIQVNPEAAGATARIAREAGLTLWRAAPDREAMVFSAAATGWHLGPFDDLEMARYAAAAFGAALDALPARPPVRLGVLSTERIRIVGARPLIASEDPQQHRQRLAPFIGVWRDAVARADAQRFAALFSEAHLHVNSYGTRSDVGQVYSGAAVLREAQQLLNCVRAANEVLADITVERAGDGATYHRQYPRTSTRLPLADLIALRGAFCTPGPGREAYPITITLGWTGERWVVLEVYLAA